MVYDIKSRYIIKLIQSMINVIMWITQFLKVFLFLFLPNHNNPNLLYCERMRLCISLFYKHCIWIYMQCRLNYNVYQHIDYNLHS